MAVGWRRTRIAAMIVGEAVMLSLLGGAVGVLLGQVGVKLIGMAPWMHGKFEGRTSPALIGVAMLLALALGVVGGLYPAWVACRLSPTEALRRE